MLMSNATAIINKKDKKKLRLSITVLPETHNRSNIQHITWIQVTSYGAAFRSTYIYSRIHVVKYSYGW